MMRKCFCLILLLACAPLWAATDDEPPKDWIDPATGHRIIRLTSEPGMASLYFHQNAYTDKGDKLVVTTADGLATIDLTTLGTAPPKVETIVQMRADTPVVGPTSRQVFFVNGGSIYATHLDTHETREIAKLPQGYTGASGLAINADETLLASTGIDPRARAIAASRPAPDAPGLALPANRGGRGEGTRSMVLFTVNIKSGVIQPVFYDTNWLNHAQFSPTDPEQLLFCHEGDWHAVNRIWTIRLNGSNLQLMHPRTMPFEIAGHEFFSFDGNMIYYDLQTPRSEKFWLAGVNIKSGQRLRYPLERSQWSTHYNQSHDGRFFSGEGGGPSSIANRTPLPEAKPLPRPANGTWIYLFTPLTDHAETIEVGGEKVNIGRLEVEKLVDLSKHNYQLEPNCVFSPDNKWIIFRSNMHGAIYTYAVEIKKKP